MVIKLISLNVNGIAEKWKQELIFDYLRTLKSDIYYSGGVGVLFCKGLDPNITVKPDTEGGVLAVKAILYETELKIVSVYTPNAPVP